jgi:hypothetical protein
MERYIRRTADSSSVAIRAIFSLCPRIGGIDGGVVGESVVQAGKNGEIDFSR